MNKPTFNNTKIAFEDSKITEEQFVEANKLIVSYFIQENKNGSNILLDEGGEYTLSIRVIKTPETP